MRSNTLSLVCSLWIIHNFPFCFLFDLPCALHCARRHFAPSMSVPFKYTFGERIYGCCVFWLCREMRVSEVKPKIITVLSINLKMLLIIITTTIRAHFTVSCARAHLCIDSHSRIFDVHHFRAQYVLIIEIITYLLLLFRMQNSYRALALAWRSAFDVFLSCYCAFFCSFFSFMKKATNILWTSSSKLLF